MLGPGAAAGRSLGDLADALPRRLGWVLAGLPTGGDDGGDRLWTAETAWWRRVETDGLDLLHRSGFGPDAPIGATAVLAVDAWRVRAALEVAARGGGRLEAFDAVA